MRFDFDEARKVRELLDQKASQPCWQDMLCALEDLTTTDQYNANKTLFNVIFKDAIEYLRKTAPEAYRLRERGAPHKTNPNGEYRVRAGLILAKLRRKI